MNIGRTKNNKLQKYSEFRHNIFMFKNYSNPKNSCAKCIK